MGSVAPVPSERPATAVPKSHRNDTANTAGRRCPEGVAHVWRPPEALTAEARARGRLLTLLAEPSNRCDGRWRWWELHQHLGRLVSTAQLRAVVDGLLAEGLVIEVRESTGDRRDARHVLVLASRWGGHRWDCARLLDVWGRPDVLARLGFMGSVG
jgi:hypothetical protein